LSKFSEIIFQKLFFRNYFFVELRKFSEKRRKIVSENNNFRKLEKPDKKSDEEIKLQK
jgi:hypothetical protein